MKITITYSGDPVNPDYDDRVEIDMDGQIVASAGNLAECPEDANLIRDLNFVLDIPQAMKAAYDAGVSGECFEIETIQETA